MTAENPSADETDADRDSTVLAAADPAVVGPWLAGALGDDAWRGCTVARVGQGRSNLTFRVDSAAGAVVLRRPPLSSMAASAHDMGREQRVLRALRDTDVPVPSVLAALDADGPLGAPAYVMELVDGVIAVDRLPAGYATEPAQRRALTEGLMDVLATLHSVDPAAIGLDGFGRPTGFLNRQLATWGRQLDHLGADADPSAAAALGALGGALGERIPESGAPGIVHGDYRIDNVVLDRTDPGHVRAVLDWEMATLGDPLADLGLMMVTWHQPDDDREWVDARVLPTPVCVPGFPTRRAVVEYYAERSGRSVEQMPWYVAFGCFKMAVVLLGIVARVRAGAAPTDTATGLADGIAPLTTLGDTVLRTGRF